MLERRKRGRPSFGMLFFKLIFFCFPALKLTLLFLLKDKADAFVYENKNKNEKEL